MNHLIELHNEVELQHQQQTADGLMVIFGGAHCNVCHSIRQPLTDAVLADYPQMQCVYIDCEALTDTCAQRQVFSLPVVKLYFGGQETQTFIRSFAISEVTQAIARPYGLVFESSGL